MKKWLWTVIAIAILILVILGFGIYSKKTIGKSTLQPINESIKNQIENMFSCNQTNKSCNQSVSIYNEEIKTRCNKLILENNLYIKKSDQNSCAKDEDCQKVTSIGFGVCGACVHINIDKDILNEYKSGYDANDCSNALNISSVSCAAVASYCKCLEGLCKVSYSP